MFCWDDFSIETPRDVPEMLPSENTDDFEGILLAFNNDNLRVLLRRDRSNMLRHVVYRQLKIVSTVVGVTVCYVVYSGLSD